MITVGTMLMLSTEEYSDANYQVPYKVLQPFDIHEVAQRVKDMPRLSKMYEWRVKNGPDDVIQYLEQSGFIELLPSEEYHLGSYGDIEVTP